MPLPSIPRRQYGCGGRGRFGLWAAVAVVPLAFLVIFFVWPVSALVVRGFFTDTGVNLAGVSEVLSAPRTWRIVGQTVAQAVVATVIAVVLGLPGAYLLYRTRFRGRRLLRAVVTIPFVLPSVVSG